MPARANYSWCATSPISCRSTRPTARRTVSRRRLNLRCRFCACSTLSCSVTRNAAASKAYVQEGEPLSPGDFIGKWMELIAPAARDVGPRGALPMEEFISRVEKASVVKSFENLMTFPCVNILVGRGKISAARRLFRRRAWRIVGAGSGDEDVRAAERGYGIAMRWAHLHPSPATRMDNITPSRSVTRCIRRRIKPLSSWR